MSFQDFFEDSPFYNLRISSHELLHLKRKKEKCPKCQRLSLYYCYSCVERMPTYIDKIPTITLPLQTYMYGSVNSFSI